MEWTDKNISGGEAGECSDGEFVFTFKVDLPEGIRGTEILLTEKELRRMLTEIKEYKY